MTKRVSKKSLLRLLAAAFALVLLAAACGSDDDDDAGDSDNSDVATAATSGSGSDDSASSSSSGGSGDDEEPTDRTGETIKIGYVNNEGGAFTLPNFRVGGEVAIAEINAQGGINGAQIETVLCLSDATPEGAINCANELIEADVVLAYMGIEVASEAAIGIWNDAGIPYISSNSWGPTEKNNDQSFILHAASAAFAVGPAKTFTELGIDHIAVILEDGPAGIDFIDNTVAPVLESNNIRMERIIVDPAAPDWAAAIATAQAADVGAIWGQLTEPGCIGMVSATAAIAYDRPVFAGSCSFFISVLGEAAVGAYTQSDLYFPDTYDSAPPEIQERLDEYSELMTAAGYGDALNSFAVAAYSAWFEMRPILESITGEITAEAVTEAFANAGPTPGWLGPDLNCGGSPWPSEYSNCSASIAVWQVEQRDDGSIGRGPVGDDGFFDAFPLSGF